MELGADLGGSKGPEDDPLCWWLGPPWEPGDWPLPDCSLPLSRECPLDLSLEEDLSSS